MTTTDPTAEYLFVPHNLIGVSQLEYFEFESASKRHNQAVDIACEEHKERMEYMKLEHKERMEYMKLEHEARMAEINKEATTTGRAEAAGSKTSTGNTDGTQ